MSKLNVVFAVLILTCFLATISFAQEWSAEQMDVWKGVQSYWDAGSTADAAALLAYWDDSYYGWSYDNEAPGTKADASKSFNYWLKKGKEQYHILTPARIWVSGDFAYVHYYYLQVTESADGKSNTEKGRWTDILMKKKGKWMLVGDHGGEIDKD